MIQKLKATICHCSGGLYTEGQSNTPTGLKLKPNIKSFRCYFKLGKCITSYDTLFKYYTCGCEKELGMESFVDWQRIRRSSNSKAANGTLVARVSGYSPLPFPRTFPPGISSEHFPGHFLEKLHKNKWWLIRVLGAWPSKICKDISLRWPKDGLNTMSRCATLCYATTNTKLVVNSVRFKLVI